MFQASADKVKKSLEGLIKIVEEQLGEKTDEVFVSMRRDYRAVLGGGEVQEGQILPRPQRLCRKEIKGVIEGVQKIFEKVVNGELDEDDPQTGDVGDAKNKEEGADGDVDENEDEDDPDGTAAGVQSDESEKHAGVDENGKEDGLIADAASPDLTESKGEDGEGVGRDEKMTTGDTEEASDAGVQAESSESGDDIAATESPSNQLSSESEHQGDASMADESASASSDDL